MVDVLTPLDEVMPQNQVFLAPSHFIAVHSCGYFSQTPDLDFLTTDMLVSLSHCV